MATLSIPAFAQDAADPINETGRSWCLDNFILQVDNDLFANSDRDYTSGVRLAMGGPLFPGQKYDPLREQLRKLTGDKGGYAGFEELAKFEEAREYQWGFSLTQLLYTPDNFFPRVPPFGERPYAAWLGAEFSVHVRDSKSLSSAALAIGATGDWALGEASQDVIHHDLTGSPYFNGWDSQLPEEITINLYLDHKRKLGFLDGARLGNFGVDGYYEFGAALGTFQTSAYVGGLVRAGWNLTNDYSVPRLQIGSYSNQFFAGDAGTEHPVSVYFLGGVRGSAVIHDMTLDGSLFQDWAFSVNSEPFVGEVILGAGVRLWDCELVYSRTLRTNEFESQNANQEFGSLQFRWSQRFH